MILDERVRLSESTIWSRNAAYYEQFGPEVWLSKGLPSYPTTNAFAVRAFARVIAAFLDEVGAPATIVELGAGPGAFAWQLCKQLDRFGERAALPDWQYVVTDLSMSNVRFCREHPQMASLVASGRVEVTQFDITADPIPGAWCGEGPLIVLGGYVFDSVPADAFELADGNLHELRVTLEAPDGVEEPDPDELSLSFAAEPTTTAGAYEDVELSQLLTEYASLLGDTTFLMPVGALGFLERVAAAHRGPCLVLTIDKGYGHPAELCRLHAPAIAEHGSVSLMVNLHALGRWTTRRGGLALHTSPRDVGDDEAALAAAALLWGAPEFPRTSLAFEQSMEHFGPADYADLQSGHTFEIREPEAPGQLARMLALLRLSAFDPLVFLRMGPALVGACQGLDREESLPVRHALRWVEEAFYPLDPAQDVHFAVGVTYHAMACWGEALAAFQRSAAAFGDTVDAAHNRGLCHWALGSPAASLACFDEALVLDPDFAPAREGRLRVQAELVRVDRGV